MRSIIRATTIGLLLLGAACTTPAERAAEEREKEARVERLEGLGNFEECVDEAGEDMEKVDACQSLQPGPAPAQ